MQQSKIQISMNKRIQKEIITGMNSNMFEFFYDSEGRMGEINNAYIKFVGLGNYKDQIHVLRIQFTYGSNEVMTFPRDPPNVSFVTPIFHPNIGIRGIICLDVLKSENWSPMYNIETIFSSIISLLQDPNPDSPLNGEAANIYVNNEKNNTMEIYTSVCQNYYFDNIKNFKKIIDMEFKPS